MNRSPLKMLKKYTMLFIFACACSLLITFSFYAITHHAWVSCFILSVICTILTLENCSLLSELRQKDDEIELLKAVHSDKLLKKVMQLENELNFMRKEREKQKLIITNLQLTNSLRKSGSF